MNPLLVIAPILALAAGIGLGYGIEKSRHRNAVSEAARCETEPKHLQLPTVKPETNPTSTTLPPPEGDPAARVAEIRNWWTAAGTTASAEERAAKLHELVLMGEAAWPEAAAMAAEMFKTDPESGDLLLKPDDVRALGILRSSHVPFMLWMLDHGVTNNFELRNWMIAWLGQRLTPDIERGLIRTLGKTSDHAEAAELVLGLRRVSRERMGEFLKELGRFSENPDVIIHSLWVLKGTRSAEAAEFAERLCASTNPHVAREARYALACLRPPAAGVAIMTDPDRQPTPGGLQHGDILVSWNGVPVKSNFDLAHNRSKAERGSQATVVVYRGSEVLTLTVNPRESCNGTAVRPLGEGGR